MPRSNGLKEKSLPGFNAHKLTHYIPALVAGVGAVALNLIGVAPNLVGWGQFAQGVIFNSGNIAGSIAGLTGLAVEVAAVPLVAGLTYDLTRNRLTHKKYKLAAEKTIKSHAITDGDYSKQLEHTMDLINSVYKTDTEQSAIIRYLVSAEKIENKKGPAYIEREKLVFEEDYIKLVVSDLCKRLAELSRLKARQVSDGRWAEAYHILTPEETATAKEEMTQIQRFLSQVINKRENVEPFGKIIIKKIKKYGDFVFNGTHLCGLELFPIPEDGTDTQQYDDYKYYITNQQYKKAFWVAFKNSTSYLTDEDTTYTRDQEENLLIGRTQAKVRQYAMDAKNDIDDIVDEVRTASETAQRAINISVKSVKTHADGTISAITADGTRVKISADGTISAIDEDGKRVTEKADKTITFIDEKGKLVTRTADGAIKTIDQEGNLTISKSKKMMATVEEAGRRAEQSISDVRANVRATGKKGRQSITDTVNSVTAEASDAKKSIGKAKSRVNATAGSTVANIISSGNNAEADIASTAKTAKGNIAGHETDVRNSAQATKTNIATSETEVKTLATKTKTAIGEQDAEVKKVAKETEKDMFEKLNEVDMVKEFTEKAMLTLLNEVCGAKDTFDKNLTKANNILAQISKNHVELKIAIVDKWFSKVLQQISAYSEEEIQDFKTFLENFHLISDTVVDLASRVGAITAVLNDTTRRVNLDEKVLKTAIAVIKEFDKTIDMFNGGLSSLDPTRINVPALSHKVNDFDNSLLKINAKIDIVQEDIIKLESAKTQAPQRNPDKSNFTRKLNTLKLYARAIAYYLEQEPNNEIALPSRKGGRSDKRLLENEIGDSSIQFSDKVLTYNPRKNLGKTFVNFLISQGVMEKGESINLDTLKFETDAQLVDELLSDIQTAVKYYNLTIVKEKNKSNFSKLTEI